MYNHFKKVSLTYLLVHQILFLHGSSSQIVIENSETFKKYMVAYYPYTVMKDNFTEVTLPDPPLPNMYLSFTVPELNVYELRFNVDEKLCNVTSLTVTIEHRRNEESTASIKVVDGVQEPVPLPLPPDNGQWPSFSANILLGSNNVSRV